LPGFPVRAYLPVLAAALLGSVATGGAASAQDAGAPAAAGSPAPAVIDTIAAGEASADAPRRRLVSWNEYEGPLFTVRVGGGYLFEYAAFSQDASSREQFTLDADWRARDARVLLNGRLKFKRGVTWSAGFMYDGPSDSWLVRQTGVMVDVPELSGHIFVGRSKEGISLNKVMVGYAGWTMERSTMNDATIPILADGVKWLGYAQKIHLLWTVGAFGDWLSEDQTFSTYDNQYVGRVAWVPMRSPTGGRLLHLGFTARYGLPDEGVLRLRSRPEAFPAPYFVETPQFAATSTMTTEIEAYYRPGPLLVGTEYFFQQVDAEESGDPFFHGGEAVVTWLATGETRAYNTRGGYFNQVSPARPVFQGGPGAWEIVGRFSYIDLDSQAIRGGRFWRLTPMVNWHLSDQVRLEVAYGYGSLDRFALVGRTHFFQTRVQLQI
jgi:phosphate-selective porin OprO/OprP